MIAGDDDGVRIVGLENRLELAVDLAVDLADGCVVVRLFVEDRVRSLKLDEAELGVVLIGEIAKRLPAHTRAFTVGLTEVVSVLVGIDPILADFLANLLEEAGRLALGVFRGGVAGINAPSNSRAGWVTGTLTTTLVMSCSSSSSQIARSRTSLALTTSQS